MFKWNNDYDDHEQIAEYLPDFERVYDEITARGQYTYNDSFKGKIPGIEGEDEDTAIYLLQGLKRINAEHDGISEALASGYERLSEGPPGESRRYSNIIVYRPCHYVGGTGLRTEYALARVFFGEEGEPFAVVPYRKQHGHDVAGAQVLVQAS